MSPKQTKLSAWACILDGRNLSSFCLFVCFLRDLTQAYDPHLLGMPHSWGIIAIPYPHHEWGPMAYPRLLAWDGHTLSQSV